jgi:predicted ATP-dependent endonuclease of OLD family
MIATQIEIANFRSFCPTPVKVPLEPVTAIVGENNVGKSNVLLALDLFRNFKKTKIHKKDFHNNDEKQAILVKVTFGALTAEERKLFRRHLSPDNTLAVTQTIKISAGEDGEDASETKSEEEGQEAELDLMEEKTASLVKSGIEWMDDPPTTKLAVEKLWKGEMKVGEVDFKAWSGLPATPAPAKEIIAAKITDFWDEKWDAIPKQVEASDTKPLGWPNKFMGHLPTVVYVPAVKKISEESKKTKSSPFGAMLDWFVGSIKAEFKETAQKKLDEFYASVMASLPKEQDAETKEEMTRLELINRELTRHLPKDFGASLTVTFKTPEANQALFGDPVLGADDGFASEITDKGHGMQRAALLAIIRAYLALKPKLDKKPGPPRRIIFAIEEPEIFLHPTVKRSTYTLFRDLAKNGDQAIYTTHDGYLLDVSAFQEIRVLRKDPGSKPPKTIVHEVSEKTLLAVWHKQSGRNNIKLESVREHLRNVYDPYRNEGFLAKKVLLCEGPTERYGLPIYFDALGFNLDTNGVSIIDAGSVSLLDYFQILFTELGIPTFVLWDGDRPSAVDITKLTGDAATDAKDKSARNIYLASLLGLPPIKRADGACFWDADQCGEKCAVLSRKYEHSAMMLLPDSDKVKGAATKLFGSDSKPMSARFYAIQAVARGQVEGDAKKYVPQIVKEMATRLPALAAAEKISIKLEAEKKGTA